MDERPRLGLVAALLCLFAEGACTPEVGNASGSGEAPSLATTAPTISTSTLPEELDSDELPTDAGPGLEFDPVSGRLILPEAGPPPPRPLHQSSKLSTDTMLREEQLGVVLTAGFIARSVAGPPNTPEVHAEGVAAAATLTAANLKITLTALGRMRMLFQSRALPLPFHSEVRSRFDRYGHLVFWPASSKYRIVPSGALRTAIGERRVDVTPVVPGTKLRTTTGTRMELTTRTVELESPLGRARIELASLPESGLGGPLLCRALVELVGVDPATSECRPEEVPLSCAIDWVDGGGIDFAVSGIERRKDLSPGEALVPPPAAVRRDDGLPDATDGVYLTQEELRSFRKVGAPVGPADPAAPPDGFIAENGRDQLMILYLDGVPVVAVPPLDKRFVIGPLPGRYIAQWRTFLGDRIDQAATVDLPGILRSAPPSADAGTP